MLAFVLHHGNNKEETLQSLASCAWRKPRLLLSKMHSPSHAVEGTGCITPHCTGL